MKTYLPYCIVFALILNFANARANAVDPSGTGSDATLKSIVLSTATTLVFSTGPSDFNYTTSVSPGTSSIKVTPTTNDAAATITVNGVAVASGTASGAITLNGIVTTTINMIVTASDGVTTHSYSIVVYETGSNNAYLSALSVSTGNSLVASAGPSNYNYTTSVSPATTSLTVTPTTADPNASVTVNGATVASGSASGAITLNGVGTPTVINLVVTAQDGTTTLSYSITVSNTGSNIATLSSLTLSTNTNLIASTGASNFNYTAAVSAATSTLTVTPTATDANSTIKVNGITVASGSASGVITLNPAGTTTDIFTVVTAQDGWTTQSYTITVSRTGSNVATLSSQSLSSNSVLIGASPNYTTDVDPALTSITQTATTTNANASFTVNGITGTSGSASGAITLNPVGSTTLITTVVKSQDGSTTKTYTITVSRNGSNDANLYHLFASTNTTLTLAGTTYTTSVPSGTTSIALAATPNDSLRATLTINGVAVPYSTYSGAIPLNAIGTPTNIPLVITAQDGTTKSFTITVNRNGSNNAYLSGLSASNGILNAIAGGPGTQVNDTTSVSLSTTSLTLTPKTSDASATITVTINGVAGPAAASGSPFTVNLAATGKTVVDMLVTAPDGVTTKLYTVTISKQGSNNAFLVWPTTFSTGTTFTNAGTGSYNANYTTTVSPATTALTVTPVPVDANATITVNGLAVANGATSSPITLNATGTTLVVIVVTAENKITTESYGITVSKTGNIFYWTGGGANTTWTTVANWQTASGGVATTSPGAGDEASIGEINYPTAKQPSLGASLTLGQLVFGQYGPPTLTIPSGLRLTIGTSLTVDSGATATIISKSAGGFVDISALATLNIYSGTGVAGKLTLTNSAANSPLTFTLKSNAAGSASVGQITSASITGNASSSVNVERYITGGSSTYRGYRFLSSPVYQSTANGNNIYSLNFVQGSSLVTGTTGPAGGFDATGNPSLYLYRENLAPSNSSFTSGNFRGISNINTAPTYSLNNEASTYNIPVGNGFMFFFRGDRTTNLANKYSAGTSAESVTMIASGTLNAGQIIVHDWYTPFSSNLGYTNTAGNASVRGFNLVGNPYPSSIDWDTYNSTTPNSGIYAPSVGSSIYIIDPVSKNYGVYMANSGLAGTNNATHIIPSGQGFFVQASAAGAQLNFNEDAKTTTQVTGANLLLGKPIQNAVSQYLHLKLKQNSLQADEIFISFRDNAQSQFVLGEDAAQKPGNGAASLASMSGDGVPLSINTLKLPKQSETIALNVGAVSDGAYELSVPEIKSIPLLFDIWLMDAYKKDSLNLRQSQAYNFNIIKSDAASYGSNRFSLVISQNPALGVHLLDFTAAKASGGVQVVWKTGNEENYTNFTVERSTDGGVSFNVLGGFVSSSLGTYSFLDKEPLLTANRYRLKLEDLDGNVSYSNVVTLMYGNLTNNIAGNLSIYPNPASSTINLSITPFNSSSVLQTNSIQNATANIVSYGIKIINITGSVIKTANSSTPSWQDDVSSLTPGTYIIQVINNSDKSVVGKSTFVKL